MKIYNWLFVRGTLKAHLVVDEEKGITLCNRKNLKFEPSNELAIPENCKCITCRKTQAKNAILEPCKEGNTQ